MWGASDILRVRLSPAIGYGRQRAEGFALLSLMNANPGIGRRWLRIMSDKEGERFYKKYQGKLVDEMVKAGLLGAYERGSGAALHVRFAGARAGYA